MFNRHPWIPVLLLLSTAASMPGCNLEPLRRTVTAPETQRPASSPSEAEQLLTYVLQARLMPPAEFALEKDRARTEFAAEKSSHNRIKLAILIALSPPSVAASAALDDAEFQALVDPLAFSAGASLASTEPALRAIATLLQGMAQDRKRLREITIRSQSTRREEASAQAEARILRIQVEDLEKKLNALKSIERSVTSRSAEGGVK
ncbi:MAG TPA: hypothetical protein VF928_01860 [Usitatibacteraceae bacterium]